MIPSRVVAGLVESHLQEEIVVDALRDDGFPSEQIVIRPTSNRGNKLQVTVQAIDSDWAYRAYQVLETHGVTSITMSEAEFGPGAPLP